jgi:hypothetical protein
MPVGGALVERSYYWSRLYCQFFWHTPGKKSGGAARTGKNGEFSLPGIYKRKPPLALILPHEPLINQMITVTCDDKTYLAWRFNKGYYFANREIRLPGRHETFETPLDFIIDLDAREGMRHAGVSVYYGIAVLRETGNAYDFVEKDTGSGLLRAGLISGKWGFVDTRGEIAIPLIYDYVFFFRGDFARIVLNDKYGFIDRNGAEAAPAKYDDVYEFQEGRALVQADGKWGFIDEQCREVIPVKYDSAYPFCEGRATVSLDFKSRFIDKNGNEIT